MSQGFYMLQSSHWHGPCTSDDTLPFGWLKKEAAAAASGFFPRLGFAVTKNHLGYLHIVRWAPLASKVFHHK